jgi:predicted SAM-dependent methyltransferase
LSQPGSTWSPHPTRYLAQSKEPKLHIGCGDHVLPGWLNADHFPTTQDIMHLDATRLFLFNDETFDYVFSEHMIEHLPYRTASRCLPNVIGSLNLSGKIRILTPNLAFLIDLGRTNKSDLQRAYIGRPALSSTAHRKTTKRSSSTTS